MLMSSAMAWAIEQTPPPVIEWEVTDDVYIITAIGHGEVVLYVNDEEVENPYFIYRPEAVEESFVVYVYATAQADGMEMSQSEVVPIEVEPKEGGEVPVDPHMSGCWLLMLDRNNNEIWQEMSFDYGDYVTIIRPYCYIFGFTYNWKSYFFDYSPIDNDIPWRYYNSNDDENIIVYDARFCFVIDGMRFGPAENHVEAIAGYALDNPLYENDNYFTMKTGKRAIMGVAFDDEGNGYVYVAYPGVDPGGITYEQNFPKWMIDIPKGDVDGDGRVNIADVTELIDLLLSETGYNHPVDDIADVDGNEIVNIADVTELIDILLSGN